MQGKREGEWRCSFTILDLDTRCEWSAFTPLLFYMLERTNGNHWIRRWMGPRVGLDAVKKTKILH
jgi:hypothetical protein